MRVSLCDGARSPLLAAEVLGATRGAGETKGVGARRRDPASQLAELVDEAVPIATGIGELLVDVAVDDLGVAVDEVARRSETTAR